MDSGLRRNSKAVGSAESSMQATLMTTRAVCQLDASMITWVMGLHTAANTPMNALATPIARPFRFLNQMLTMVGSARNRMNPAHTP